MSLTLTRRHNVDRFGYLIPTQYGNVPMVGAVATYRPGEGRFGGAVAVEEGTTNLVPSNRLKFEGWSSFSGAQVTRTQNVEFPEIGRNDATRIRTTGGTATLKYYTDMGKSVADQAYTGSVYIKNIGSKPVRFRTQLGPSVIVNPGEWTRAIASGIGNGTSNFQLRFEALNADDDLDFIAWGPQAEHKPFATSFVAGTRAAGRLRYPVNFNMDEGTIRCFFYLDKSAVLNATTTYPTVFVARQGTGARNLLWVYFGEEKTRLTFQRRTDSGSTLNGYVFLANRDDLSDGWHEVAIVWDHASGIIRTYLDGEFKGTAVYNKNDLIPLDTIDVGYRQGSSDAGNMLIDELLILPYAASDEEIRAWYESDSPLPPHPDALLQWDWQAVRPATMVAL